MRQGSMDPILKQVFMEEIGKLRLIFQRRDPGDYEEYKRIVCRLQLIVELHKRNGSTLKGACYGLMGDRQYEFEELLKSNPFNLDGKETLNWGQVMFYFRARACAR